MALDNLRAFLDAIDARGDLVRVARPVSVDKEMTEIADRCMKSPGGGPALLCTHPTLGSGAAARQPVAVNLFGSERRMALALGVERLDDVGERIATLLNLKVPDSWPEDGGPYITLPGVITRDPATGVRNVGMYRIQVIGKNELAMHWQRHKVGAAHWREMAQRGERMPVAIALGGDPASIYAASAPLPPTIDEFLFAGFLRREPVRLARAVTSDLEVPAEA